MNLSPLMSGTRGTAMAPEAELVKRGRQAAASAAAAAAAVAASAPPARSKAAAKAEQEAERKALLQGLDAVMEDLQRRADDKRRKEAEEKEAKTKAVARSKAAAAGGETKALGGKAAPAAKSSSSAGAGSDAALAMKAATKLTIPKLKAFIAGVNEGALPAGKAKKDEYVRAAVELLVQKAQASSMAEALKSLASDK